MNSIPSIYSELNKNNINSLIKKNFSIISPHFFKLTNEWFKGAYNVFQDIEKYLILIYFVNKDFEFYRRNNINLTYDLFYKSNHLDIIETNIIKISKDLNIPKENVRRKILSLVKDGIITKKGKKIRIDRSAYSSSQPIVNLRNVSSLLSVFTSVLKKEGIHSNYFTTEQVSKLIKQNFSFCWYQFYKFLFSFSNRWQSYLKDFEIYLIFSTIIMNSSDKTIKKLKKEVSYLEKWRSDVQKTDFVGINAMSISSITNIPRPTVVRKLNFLVKNKYLRIDKKKLYYIKLSKKNFKELAKRQDENLQSISDFITRVFNQINLT